MPPTGEKLGQQRRQQHEGPEKRHKPFDPNPVKKKPVFGHGPRALKEALKDPEYVSGPGAKPNTGALALATLPEWYVYWALMRLGKRPQIDFVYRGETSYASLSSQTQLDFSILDGSRIAIEVQGTYWHYEQGSAKLVQDYVRSANLSSQWQVINIDEDDVVGDPSGNAAIYMVKEALLGHDHSWRYRQFLRNPIKPN